MEATAWDRKAVDIMFGFAVKSAEGVNVVQMLPSSRGQSAWWLLECPSRAHQYIKLSTISLSRCSSCYQSRPLFAATNSDFSFVSYDSYGLHIRTAMLSKTLMSLSPIRHHRRVNGTE